MVPVSIACIARWVAHALRLLIGLTALTLVLSAGNVPAPAVGLPAPTAASVPAVDVVAPTTAEPTDLDAAEAGPADVDRAAARRVGAGPVVGERAETDRTAVRRSGGERAESDGQAWTLIARVGGRWAMAPRLRVGRGPGDAARTAHEAAVNGPVGQRAPPRG